MFAFHIRVLAKADIQEIVAFMTVMYHILQIFFWSVCIKNSMALRKIRFCFKRNIAIRVSVM